MQAALLALALATCAESPGQCQAISTDLGVIVSVCGLAPDREGKTISFKARVNDRRMAIIVTPKCVET